MWSLWDSFICNSFRQLTFLPFSDRPPAARREPTRDLFKVDVIVPILIEGMKQAWKTRSITQITFRQRASLWRRLYSLVKTWSKSPQTYMGPHWTSYLTYPWDKSDTYCLTFIQWGVDGRRDQRDESFQVKAASSGLSFQQPVALLQVYNVRLLHCRTGSRGKQSEIQLYFRVLHIVQDWKESHS